MMEPRDAYRRPEVFAFMDVRMLGAFVSTSRSAKTAARECDAWSAIARRQHERPTYFGGKPGSNEHMTFLHRTFHAPEFYALEPGQTDVGITTLKRLYHMSEFIKFHSRSIRVLDGDIYNPATEEDVDFELQDSRPLRDMTILPDPGQECLLLIGRSTSPSVPPVVADVPELADALDEFEDALDETELAQLGQAIRAFHAARGGPPAWMRADESDGDDDSDGDEDSDDGDSSIEAILAEAVQRLRS